MAFAEYDLVRISELIQSDRSFDGAAGVVHQPRIGDQGTIVCDISSDDFTVESVDGGGNTVRLADFSANELELLSKAVN